MENYKNRVNLNWIRIINPSTGEIFYVPDVETNGILFLEDTQVSNALTASYVESASYAFSSSYAESSSFSQTSSYSFSSSYAESASYSLSSSYAESSSYSISSSYALNGGVTQIIAGTNITISPSTGVGNVTISSTGGGSGSASGGLPPRFILEGTEYTIPEGFQAEIYDIYNYGTLTLQPGTVVLPLGREFITNNPLLLIENLSYNAGIINNGGIIINKENLPTSSIPYYY
jgi:hypothetical protein